jgi:GMP synthase-like glutamine amidotransferase
MRILFLQHDPLDGPGALIEWAHTQGYTTATCLICEGQPPPPLDSFDLLISLGGPMGAYEEEKHPWLALEKQYLRDAVAAGKKLVGLCLGCQLLADALGGKAYRHTIKEFGWQPIMLTEEGKKLFPEKKGADSTFAPENHEKGQFLALKAHEKSSFLAFQWHGDTYSLPPGAVQLARNEACEQQAFLIGKQVLGLQFHLEWTESMMRDALADPGVALSMIPSPTVQTPEEILSDLSLFQSGKKRFFALMDRFVASS